MKIYNVWCGDLNHQIIGAEYFRAIDGILYFYNFEKETVFVTKVWDYIDIVNEE